MVHVERVIHTYDASKDRDKIFKKLQGKTLVDFDTYFNITTDVIKERKMYM